MSVEPRDIADLLLPLVFAGVSLTLFLQGFQEPGYAFAGAAIGAAPGGLRRGAARGR